MPGLGFGLDPGGGRVRRRDFEFAGSLPPGASLARASAGTRYDAGGTMVSEAANVARFDHDPVTRQPRGLLIEPARTNLLPRASALDHASWSGSGVTVAADAAASPDGTMSADLLTAGLANSYLYAEAALAADTIYTFSVHARSSGTAISVNQFMLSASGAAVAWGPQVIATAPAWQRHATSGSTAGLTAPFLATIGLGDSFSSGEQLYLWGCQVEAGPAATSFIPTSGASATRAADVLTLDWSSRGIADGLRTVRYTFDDESVQDVATTVSGGSAVVPVTLNRRWLRRAQAI